MDQDKTDKTIEIILQNQAQFYTELQQTRELQKEMQENFEKRSNSLEKATVNLIESVKQTNETVRELSKNVDELRVAQKETDERLKNTGERLNAVIYMAEKFFQPWCKRQFRIT